MSTSQNNSQASFNLGKATLTTLFVLGLLLIFTLVASLRGWGYPSARVEKNNDDSSQTQRTHISTGWFGSSYFFYSPPSVREGSVGGSSARGGSFRSSGK